MTPEDFGRARAAELEEAINNWAPIVSPPLSPNLSRGGRRDRCARHYWPEVQRICDHYGILLIADEVICGFGRTGIGLGPKP